MLSRMRSFLTGFTPPEPAIPKDRHRIPCAGLDLEARDVVLTNGLVIDKRLDVEKLEKTLFTLVQTKFPRAGARLVLVNGIPHRFDANTPPVLFTTENYDEGYHSPDRPTIPICSRQPSAQPMPLLQQYFRSKGCPTSLDGFLKPDVPLVHVHVTTFDDLSFVGITSSHVTFDAMGTGIFLRTWTRIINGEDEDSIPGMPWDAAPFESFKGKDVSNRKGWFDLAFFSKLNFIVRFVYRILKDTEEVMRLVCVPKTFLDAAKEEINNQLRLEGSQEWVGSVDVLMAWWYKTAYAHRSPKDTTPIHIHMPMDLRGFPVFPGNAKLSIPYINNSALSIAIPPIPVNAFRTESLASLALRIRRTILAYTADLDWMRAAVQFRCAYPFKDVFPRTAWRGVCHAFELAGCQVYRARLFWGVFLRI
ncbi:hypothetical protein MSAN_02490000 [Mycena sanguinolenta]|uniref:Uncharacterized protein n=1 Tax=Mycena sanguinolenta TaxID=230812 RepID=A0A8H6U3I5_9AGAR|nr:hypothetical protein MSAN_02490000 [Mycena sanguinolenta]